MDGESERSQNDVDIATVACPSTTGRKKRMIVEDPLSMNENSLQISRHNRSYFFFLGRGVRVGLKVEQK